MIIEYYSHGENNVLGREKMAETIYIRMRHRIQKKSNERIFLKDLAQIIATDELCKVFQKYPFI